MKQLVILACAMGITVLLYWVGKMQYIRGMKVAD